MDVITVGGAAWSFPKGPRYHHYVQKGDPVAWAGRALMANVIKLDRDRPDDSLCPMTGTEKINHSLCSYMENYERFRAEDEIAFGR